MKVVALLGAAFAVAVLAAPATQAAQVQQHCPAGALVLPADATTRAAHAALASAASDYRGLNTKGATVLSAKRATAAGPRGAQVAHECGATARARTVVVELHFPKMAPSASLSEGTVDVSRFRNGFRVWAVVH
ncbi:MAG TPA: hypothetical protein VFA30_11075 [Gaiellaceae bacterium]|nr:hypothetical protein [Gaiellaceae bacterium]